MTKNDFTTLSFFLHLISHSAYRSRYALLWWTDLSKSYGIRHH